MVFVRAQQRILHFLEQCFVIHGRLVVRYPWLYISFSLIVAIGLGLAVAFLQESGQEDWLPLDSDFVVNNAWIGTNLPSMTTGVSVLVVAKENVLESNHLRAMFELRQNVLNMQTDLGKWKDACLLIDKDASTMTILRNVMFNPQIDFPDQLCKPYWDTKINGENNNRRGDDVMCTENHLLELFIDNEGNLQDDLDENAILKALNAPRPISKISRRPVFVPALLGGIERDNATNSILSARAAMLRFTLDRSTQDSEDLLDQLQSQFVNLSLNQDWPQETEAFPFTSKSFGDVSGQDIEQDLGMLLYGYGLVLIYIMLFLGKGCSFVHTRAPLSLLGIVVVVMGFFSAGGLYALMGLKVGGMTDILPFLLLGIGIDDMFVVVQSYDNVSEKEGKDGKKSKKAIDNFDKEKNRENREMEERVGEAMRHGGMAILITTITDVLAFGVGSTTVVPALRSFCIYAALGISFIFGFVNAFFLPIFVLDQRRMERRRNAFLCCIRHKNKEEKDENEEEDAKEDLEKKEKMGITENIFGIYAKLLVQPLSKFIVVVGTTCLLLFSGYNLSQLETDFQEKWFLPKESYPYQFITKMEEMFPDRGNDGAVYFSDPGQMHNASLVLKQLSALLTDESGLAEDNLVKEATSNNFPVLFENFMDQKLGNDDIFPENLNLNAEEFNNYLAEFMWTTPMGLGQMRRVLSFESELTCNKTAPNLSIVTIPYRHRRKNSSLEGVDLMNSLHNALAEFKSSFLSNSSVLFASSSDYRGLLTVDIITSELLRNILLALLCVFAATFLLIGNFSTCVLVTCNVSLTLLNVAGFMHVWGLTIESVTSLLIIIAMGLSVDYSAHVAHAFVVQDKQLAKDKRVVNAIVEMGPAVLNGGMSTFMAFALLALAKSYVFATFFKVFFLVVVLGMVHGLVVLPVVLALLGPVAVAPLDQDEDVVVVQSELHSATTNEMRNKSSRASVVALTPIEG